MKGKPRVDRGGLVRIVVDILYGRAEVFDGPPKNIASLKVGVAEVINRRLNNEGPEPGPLPPQVSLSEEVGAVVEDIFWDLVAARVITPTFDGFRLSGDFRLVRDGIGQFALEDTVERHPP